MKNYTLLLLAAACTLSAGARQLTPAEALASVQGARVSAVRAMAEPKAQPRLVYTQSHEGLNTAYIFNTTNDGFMVLSADDAATPVLGYSTVGAVNSISPAMQAWLEDISAEVAFLAANPGQYTAPAEGLAPIAPLCQTTWGQGSPYNNLCPTVQGEKTVTGCVATAMAQIMKHYQYPAQGTGSITYRDQYYNKITCDFTTPFLWNKMIPSYSGEYTAEEADAVATLMFACGAGSKMTYASASGTTTTDAMYGLINYFGYDKGLRLASRFVYDRAEWEQLMYSELSQGRPILYGGQGNGGGHQFVCDGYDKDGYFHMNWGWDGLSDGYFLLSMLNPSALGTGGGGGGFNFMQDAVIGFVPDQGTTEMVPNIVAPASIATNKDSYTLSSTSKVTINTVYFNFSPDALTVNLGLKLVDADGNLQYVSSASSKKLQTSMAYTEYTLNASDFPAGDWTASMAYKLGDEWHDITMAYNAQKTLNLHVTESAIEVLNNNDNPNLKLSITPDLPETLYPADWMRFSATVTNNGREYVGIIMPELVAVNNANNTYTADYQPVDLNQGQSQTVTFNCGFSGGAYGNAPTAGKYQLYFLSQGQEIVAGPFDVTVASTPTISVGDVSIASADKQITTTGNGTQADPYIVPADPAIITAQYQCAQTINPFVSAMIMILDESTGYATMVTSSDEVEATVEGGTPTNVNIPINLTGVATDILYIILPQPNPRMTFSYVKLTKGNSVAGINADEFAIRLIGRTLTVTAPRELKTVEVFDLTGRRVAFGAQEQLNIEALSAGNYIVRATLTDGTTLAKQIMTR